MSTRPPVGVLGGTFDPVHLGHLNTADHVRQVLGLPRVLLLPTAVPPHKDAAELAPAHHREAMLRLALAGRAGLALCELELEPARVSYTIDTLRALRRGVPGCEPIFVLGADALLQLHEWRAHDELTAEFDLAVIGRLGQSEAEVGARLGRALAARIVPLAGASAAEVARLCPGTGGRIFTIPMAPIPISSSAIRARAAAGDSLANLVPDAVAEYIQATGLYRREDDR